MRLYFGCILMSFPEGEVKKAWSRSGGKCECTRSQQNCHTGYRCNKTLEWSERGKETTKGWEAHHKDRSKASVASNCEILCQKCHKATRSYGNP